MSVESPRDWHLAIELRSVVCIGRDASKIWSRSKERERERGGSSSVARDGYFWPTMAILSTQWAPAGWRRYMSVLATR